MALPFKYYILNEQEIESGALDLRYYTKTQADGRYVLKETGKQLIESAILTDLTDGGNTTLHKHDDKADKIYATNFVTNGDFSNGTNGWSSANSTISATNNTLSIVGTGVQAYAGSYFSFPTKLANRKYYWKLKIRTTGTGSTYMRCFCNNVTVDRTIVAVVNPVQNQWYEASIVLSPIVNISNIHCYMYYATAPEIVNKTMEVQYVLAIDLTAIFGAGNEPTKEQMDRLLSTYPNSWFNGTAEITNIKQVFNEKADRLFATNLVTNGDFSNGTTGWSAVSATGFSVVGGIAKFTPTAQYGRIISQTISLIINNKYYTYADVKTINSDKIGVGLMNGTTDSAATTNVLNTSQRISTIQKANASTPTYVGVLDYRTSLFDEVEVYRVGCINLTQTFGIGKEPTKEQMDWLLAQKYTNSWFDGTKELTSITDLLTLVNTKANIAQETWRTPTLSNGWSGTLKYRKNQFNQLEGYGILTVGTGTIGTIIANFPSSYYNANAMGLITTYNNNTGATPILRINVGGALVIVSTLTTGHVLYLSFTIPIG